MPATCPAHIGLHLITLVPFDKALLWVSASKLRLIPSLKYSYYQHAVVKRLRLPPSLG